MCSGRLLISFLLSIILLQCSEGFRIQQQPGQRLARQPMWRSLAVRHGNAAKPGSERTNKLLLLAELLRRENDVIEPKRKRGFPGNNHNNAPLDRLSASAMETKQTTNKQSKVVELPRRRPNPPPMDRIGMSRLPNSRG